jgi:hypothetical protein
VDHQSGSKAGSSRLIDYLPRSEQGHIVFTSRDRKTAVELARHNVVKVPEIKENVDTELLYKCLIKLNLVSNVPDTRVLLKSLTYLLLAIVQEIAYINKSGIIFAEYLSLLME